jgi:WD40 repeat protein
MKKCVKPILVATWFATLVAVLFYADEWGTPRSGVSDLAFSPNGAWLAAARRDYQDASTTTRLIRLNKSRTISVFETQTWGMARVIDQDSWQRKGGGNWIAFLDDAPTLAVLRFEPRKGIYAINSDGLVRELVDINDPGLGRFVDNTPLGKSFDSIAVSGDGKSIAAGHLNSVALWDMATGDRIALIDAISHRGIRSADFVLSRDARTIVTAGLDGVEIWDVHNDQTSTSLEGSPEGISWRADEIALSPKDELLAVGCRDWLRLYDLKGRFVSELSSSRSIVDAVCFSPDGKELAASFRTKSVKFFDVTAGAESKQPVHAIPESHILCYSPDGKYLATDGAGSTISVWNAKSRTLHKTLRAPGKLLIQRGIPVALLVASTIVLLWKAPRYLLENA